MVNPEVITRHPIEVTCERGNFRAHCPSLGLRREHHVKELAVRRLELAIMASLAERNLKRGKR